MKVATLQRAEFIRAQGYLSKWDAYHKKLASGQDVAQPEVDIALEPLVEVLQKNAPCTFTRTVLTTFLRY